MSQKVRDLLASVKVEDVETAKSAVIEVLSTDSIEDAFAVRFLE